MRARWRTVAAVPLAVALAAVGVLAPRQDAVAVDAQSATRADADPVAPAGPPLELATPQAWLPHPLPAPQVPSVAFVGDSIGRDAQSSIRSQIGRTHPIAYYHSVAAGYIGYHLPRLLPVVQASGGPDVLLVELGTGDAFWDHSSARFERDVRRFLDEVLNLAPSGEPVGAPHVTCVRWFDQKPTANIAYPHVNEHRLAFNRILGRVLAEPRYRSRNVALVPYAAWYWLSGDSGYFLADRLHHTRAGARELGLLAGQAAEGCNPSFTSGPFWDVPDRSRWAESVAWMGTAGIADPYRNGTYRAQLGSLEVPLDRGQFAEYLWRLAGSPTSHPPSSRSDVPDALRPAVGWVEAEGIMRGYPDGTFRAADVVTRVALAVYLWRAMRQPTQGVAHHTWPDVPAEYVAAVDWAVSAGLLAPFPSGNFGSESPVSRGLVARSLHSLAQLIARLEATASTAAAPPAATAPPSTIAATSVPPRSVPPTTTPPATTAPTTTASTTTMPPGAPTQTSVPREPDDP